ncbi:MAG: hypothetical protein PVI89_18275 [Desulfobacteraceae bacterium]|jgi:hypothetical protein
MVNKPTSIEIKGKGNVSAVLSGPDQLGESNKTGVIIAHGASNDMHNSLIVAVADGLAATGYTTLRFNFPYKEKGKKSPDAEPTLIRTWQGAVTHLLNNGDNRGQNGKRIWTGICVCRGCRFYSQIPSKLLLQGGSDRSVCGPGRRKNMPLQDLPEPARGSNAMGGHLPQA